MGPRNIVVIIGNGFDLDLGLKTSYKDFWESDFCPKDFPAPLIDHLNKHWPGDLDSVRWYDLENELYNYCKAMKPDQAIKDVINDKERKLLEIATPYRIACSVLYNYPYEANSLIDKGYIVANPKLVPSHLIPYREEMLLPPEKRDYEALQRIKSGLCKYISSLKRQNDERNTCAHQVLDSILHSNESTDAHLVHIYSFNYTPLLHNGNTIDNVPVFHVHGDVEKEKIIVGSRDDVEMDIRYDFITKSYDPSYSPPGLVYDLQTADEVIIFGHSIGINDRQYFESFFGQQASTNNSKPKKITLFTKDDISELEIRRALQVMTGGRLASLCSITQLKIIKTSLLKKGDKQTQQYYYDFLLSMGCDEHYAKQLIGRLKKPTEQCSDSSSSSV